MENKIVRYAVIGTGVFGNAHVENLKLIPNVKIVAICDMHKEKAEAVAKANGIEAVYDDYNEMLKRDDIDIVVVATGDKQHRPATVAALNSGKHVVCEKPMALFLSDCKEMIKAADEAKKLLMVGQICRYTPAFVEAKKLIEKGVIGELYYVESEYAHDYAKISGTDKWRMDKDRSPVIGGACHAIDLLRWIAGDPTDVSAFSNHKVLKDWPVDDCTVAIFKFPNDVIGKVFTSIGCKRDYTMRTVLYGTKGTIIVSNTDTHLTLHMSNENCDQAFKDAYEGSAQIIQHKIPVDLNSHNIRAEHDNMIDAFLNGVSLTTTGRDGAKTVAVCDATVESAKTGKTVTIDYNF